MFYTRIPCSVWVDHSPEILNKATRYLPIIGIIVGILASGVFYMSSPFFPLQISVALSMVTTILVTGAFHEDGFADSCDGFGGGWDKMQILTIMKDSRIGSYGTIGLVLILLLKFLILSAIHPSQIFIVIIAAHGLSRLTPVCIIYLSTYVREDELSKAKPIGKKISIIEVIFATASVVWLLFFINVYSFWALPVTMTIIILCLRYFNKRLGGYTGDCLGASQQVTEIALYFTFYLACK